MCFLGPAKIVNISSPFSGDISDLAKPALNWSATIVIELIIKIQLTTGLEYKKEAIFH
jgi:hypothetical protein